MVLSLPEHSPYKSFGRALAEEVGAIEGPQHPGKVPTTVPLPRFQAEPGLLSEDEAALGVPAEQREAAEAERVNIVHCGAPPLAEAVPKVETCEGGAETPLLAGTPETGTQERRDLGQAQEARGVWRPEGRATWRSLAAVRAATHAAEGARQSDLPRFSPGAGRRAGAHGAAP